MARLAELVSTIETVSCIWYPDLRSQACAPSGAGIIYSEIIRTGTQTRYAPYAVLGSDVRAFRLCASAEKSILFSTLQVALLQDLILFLLYPAVFQGCDRVFSFERFGKYQRILISA